MNEITNNRYFGVCCWNYCCNLFHFKRMKYAELNANCMYYDTIFLMFFFCMCCATFCASLGQLQILFCINFFRTQQKQQRRFWSQNRRHLWVKGIIILKSTDFEDFICYKYQCKRYAKKLHKE